MKKRVSVQNSAAKERYGTQNDKLVPFEFHSSASHKRLRNACSRPDFKIKKKISLSSRNLHLDVIEMHYLFIR